MRKLHSLRAELGLLLLCLFLFCWQLGNAPLLDLDEALYVTCAQQMVVSGDWVTPRLNTRQPERPGVTAIPFFEKPILVYWASAGSMRVLGRNLWAARLPVALAALLTTLAITLFGRWCFNRRAGLLAGAIFATAPMTLVDARQMTTDGLLTLWLTLALLCFWRSQEKGDRGQATATRVSLSPLFFWLLCALAVLTKGAVGMLLPLLIISVYLLLDRVLLRIGLRSPRGPRLRFAVNLYPLSAAWTNFKRLRPLAGLLLFLAVAAPWHLRIVGSQERDAQGRTWVAEYIQRQHIGRFKGLDTVHNQPLPTYAVYFFVFFFPWAGFAPAAFRYRKQTEPVGEYPERAQPSAFLLIWFWTLIVFFSLGAAKLPTYIAPAYPPAALLVGRWLDSVLTAEAQQEWRQDDKMRKYRSLRRGALSALSLGVLLLIALPIAPRFVPPRAPLPEGVIPLAWHLALTLTIGSALAWLCFRMTKTNGEALSAESAALRMHHRPPNNMDLPATHPRTTMGVGALIAMMVVVVGILGGEGYGVLRRSVLGPYQQVAAAAQPDAQRGLPVVYYNVIPRRPSMNFYAGYAPFEHKEIPLLPFLARCLPPGGHEADVVLTYDAYTRLLQPEIEATPGAAIHLLLQRGPKGEWALTRVTLPASEDPPSAASFPASK